MLYKDYLDFLKSPQKEAIYITEHEQCITLGKNSLENEILIKNQIPVFNSTRGGGATYHGPGQLMVYPYFSLKKQQIYISDEAWTAIIATKRAIINKLQQAAETSNSANDFRENVLIDYSKTLPPTETAISFIKSEVKKSLSPRG